MVPTETLEFTSDPTGMWLHDHEEYLGGRISYGELQRRNGKRYRSSLPLCSTGRLTDSEEGARRETAEQQQAEIERDVRDAMHFRRTRLWAISSSVVFAVGLVLIAVFAVMREWLLIAVIGPHLVSSFLTAARLVHEWRNFDE